MRTITPIQALQGNQYAVVGRDGHVYGLYPDKDMACRICHESDALIDAQERKIKKLEAENENLVNVLHEVESEAVHAYHALQHDCEYFASKNCETFHKCWREEVENARLRELVRDMGRCITYQHDCTDCTINGEGCDASVLCSIRTGELGIEVD